MATRNGKHLLSRDDWARVALEAIGEGGVPAVNIDRLAARLDATRGSFYWRRDPGGAIEETLLARPSTR